jgi:hypothetical protein
MREGGSRTPRKGVFASFACCTTVVHGGTRKPALYLAPPHPLLRASHLSTPTLNQLPVLSPVPQTRCRTFDAVCALRIPPRCPRLRGIAPTPPTPPTPPIRRVVTHRTILPETQSTLFRRARAAAGRDRGRGQGRGHRRGRVRAGHQQRAAGRRRGGSRGVRGVGRRVGGWGGGTGAGAPR